MAARIRDFCMCEHEKHFGGEDYPPHEPLPNIHNYGQKFKPEELKHVKTTHGFFSLCKSCAEDCLAAYIVDNGKYMVEK